LTLHVPRRFYLKSTLARGPKFGVNYKVYFETENATLRFSYADVVEKLPYYDSTFLANEATTLHDLPYHSDHSIWLPPELYKFVYLALDLIEKGKGVVYCKECKRYYEAKELNGVVVGHGESPFSVNVKGRGWLRRFFGKKQRLPFFGGKGCQCPDGHELIGLVTWRT
jgi:hypothetical protein